MTRGGCDVKGSLNIEYSLRNKEYAATSSLNCLLSINSVLSTIAITTDTFIKIFFLCNAGAQPCLISPLVSIMCLTVKLAVHIRLMGAAPADFGGTAHLSNVFKWGREGCGMLYLSLFKTPAYLA